VKCGLKMCGSFTEVRFKYLASFKSLIEIKQLNLNGLEDYICIEKGQIIDII
jgi:hypothetical protein